MRGSRLTKIDFKPGRQLFSGRRRRRRWPWWGLVAACGVAVILFMWSAERTPADASADAITAAPRSDETPLALPPIPTTVSTVDTRQPESQAAVRQQMPETQEPKQQDLVGEEPPAQAVPEPPAEELASDTPDPEHLWEVLDVHRGDSLSALFGRTGISAAELHQLLQADGSDALRRIHPGDEIHIRADDDRQLLALRYKLSEDTTLIAERNDQGFDVSRESTPPDIVPQEAHGVISTSLFLAGRDAGLDDRLIMELAGIFGWDIDFALDIRSGDRFAVIYEGLYRDGQYIRSGDILAAEFVSRGRSFRALRHVDSEGQTAYYSPDGRSMRKAFLRSPVDFHRISSNFNPNRLHPVLGTSRPHRGVDYAARTGTPIRAAGDGRVVHRGRHGGYGNAVIIQHGSRYRTLYAHLSRFASGVTSGQRVRQGQVIGYVGMSGLATGPHLHYEFLVDGRHRDPVRVNLPDAEPIAERYRESFLADTASLMTRLDALQPQEMALRDDE